MSCWGLIRQRRTVQSVGGQCEKPTVRSSSRGPSNQHQYNGGVGGISCGDHCAGESFGGKFRHPCKYQSPRSLCGLQEQQRSKAEAERLASELQALKERHRKDLGQKDSALQKLETKNEELSKSTNDQWLQVHLSRANALCVGDALGSGAWGCGMGCGQSCA